MTDKIDLPKESLHNPGNIWINKESGQIRYSLSKDEPSKWLTPLSIYEVGNDPVDNSAFIKRGQPVSIGILEDLDDLVKQSADPSVVPTDPHKYQWSIGIALEPGNATKNIDNKKIFNQIHILSHGQIEYDLSDTRENVFQPPNKNGKYLWTYDDIGKVVYVSNHPDDNDGKPGGLTIDINHAYYNGANVVSVGRIADAPATNQVKQNIVIEVQLAGDVRGIIDSTQFDITISDQYTAADKIITQYDKMIFVKILNVAIKNPITGLDEYKPENAVGYLIRSDEDLLETEANSPLGCFIARPVNGEILLNQWNGKSILVHRLGIIEGHFNYGPGEFGRELYLRKGDAVTIGAADSYEYKVGMVIGSLPNGDIRVLVDCRYPRMFKKFAAVGTIRPCYMEMDTINPPGKLITDPGFVAMIPGIPHKVSGVWPGDTQVKGIDFAGLLQATMYNGFYEYCDNKKQSVSDPDEPNGNWRDIDGNFSFDSPTPGSNGNIVTGFFRFKTSFYQTPEGKVPGQIKYSQEGAPDDMEYIWPEMMFEYKYVNSNYPNPPPYQSYESSTIRFNIDKLADLGIYLDGQGKSIENYEITLTLPDYGDVSLHPGFYVLNKPIFGQSGIDDIDLFYGGYEWAIKEENGHTYLLMVTLPGSPSDNLDPSKPKDYINPAFCLGVCWPLGKIPDKTLNMRIFIRRRPIQYHNLFVNQLEGKLGWASHVDASGNNLITDNNFYFGSMISGHGSGNQENIWTQNLANGIIRLDQVEPKILEGGSGKIYSKELDFYFGPHPDNGTQEWINILRHRFSPINHIKNSTYKRYIDWIYDFDNQIVELTAEFAPMLVAPSTRKDLSGAIEIDKKVYNIEDYNNGKTYDNPSGIYQYQRSALKTLHEIPVQFFNYMTDRYNQGWRIGTAQEGWEENGTLERYLPKNFVREIFTTVSGVAVNGTTYEYDDINASSIYEDHEWKHIQDELDILFSPIIRTVTGTVGQGGDKQYYQNNIALLNYGAKETQDRLLRIERALFGADAPTLPYGTITSTQFNLYKNHYETYEDSLDNGGILRITNELFHWGMLKNEADIYSGPSTDPFRAYSSTYRDIYIELFGEYESLEEFKRIPGNLDGKFHDVYLWYKQIATGTLYNLLNFGNWFCFNKVYEPPLETAEMAVFSAANIYLFKSQKGYFFENTTDQNDVPSIGTLPFGWPINIQNDISYLTNWKGVDSFRRWWWSDKVGLPDKKYLGPPKGDFSDVRDYYSEYEKTENWKFNFVSETVEGVLYDIIAKLSYLKEMSDNEKQGLKGDLTTLSKTQYLIRENIPQSFDEIKDVWTFRAQNAYDYNSKTNSISQNQIILKDQCEFLSEVPGKKQIVYNGEYSAFGFEKGKFSNGWNLQISPKWLPLEEDTDIYNQDLGNPFFSFVSGSNSLSDSINYWRNKKLFSSSITDPLYTIIPGLPDNFIKYRYESSGKYDFNFSGFTTTNKTRSKSQDINHHFHNNLSGILESNRSKENEAIQMSRLGETIQRHDKTQNIIIPTIEQVKPWDTSNYISGWLSPDLREQSETWQVNPIDVSGELLGYNEILTTELTVHKVTGQVELFSPPSSFQINSMNAPIKDTTASNKTRLDQTLWYNNSTWYSTKRQILGQFGYSFILEKSYSMIARDGTEIWGAISGEYLVQVEPTYLGNFWFDRNNQGFGPSASAPAGTGGYQVSGFMEPNLVTIQNAFMALPNKTVNALGSVDEYTENTDFGMSINVDKDMTILKPEQDIWVANSGTITEHFNWNYAGHEQFVSGWLDSGKYKIDPPIIYFTRDDEFKAITPLTIEFDSSPMPNVISQNYSDVGIKVDYSVIEKIREIVQQNVIITEKYPILTGITNIVTLSTDRKKETELALKDFAANSPASGIYHHLIMSGHSKDWYEEDIFVSGYINLHKDNVKISGWQVGLMERNKDLETRTWDVSEWPQQIVSGEFRINRIPSDAEFRWPNDSVWKTIKNNGIMYDLKYDYFHDKINLEYSERFLFNKFTSAQEDRGWAISRDIFDNYPNSPNYYGPLKNWGTTILGGKIASPEDYNNTTYGPQNPSYKGDLSILFGREVFYNKITGITETRFTYMLQVDPAKPSYSPAVRIWDNVTHTQTTIGDIYQSKNTNDGYNPSSSFPNLEFKYPQNNSDYITIPTYMEIQSANLYISGTIFGGIYNKNSAVIVDPSTKLTGVTGMWTLGPQWLVSGKISGLVQSELVSGYVEAVPNVGGTIAYKDTIDGFSIRGTHIPEDYDMLSRIRAKEHVADQIHLHLEPGPYKYPKVNIPLTKKLLSPNASWFLADNYIGLMWKPVNLFSSYLITRRDSEEQMFALFDDTQGSIGQENRSMKMYPWDSNKQLCGDANSVPDFYKPIVYKIPEKYKNLTLKDLYYGTILENNNIKEVGSTQQTFKWLGRTINGVYFDGTKELFTEALSDGSVPINYEKYLFMKEARNWFLTKKDKKDEILNISNKNYTFFGNNMPSVSDEDKNIRIIPCILSVNQKDISVLSHYAFYQIPVPEKAPEYPLDLDKNILANIQYEGDFV